MTTFKKITSNKFSDEFFVIINENNEFLYRAWSDGVDFTENLELAAHFRRNKSGKLSFLKIFRYVNNQKVKSVEHLAEVIGGRIVKVQTETFSQTNYSIHG